MSYKVLVTVSMIGSNSTPAIHAQVVEFETRARAEEAIKRIEKDAEENRQREYSQQDHFRIAARRLYE